MIREVTPQEIEEFKKQQLEASSVVVSALPNAAKVLVNQPTPPNTQHEKIAPDTAASKPGGDSNAAPQNTTSAAVEFVEAEYIEEIPEGGYEPLIHETFIELLAYYDEQVNTGAVTLHPWQVTEGEFISRYPADKLNPLKYVLCASNGSGKDSFIVAPFAVWFACTKIKARVVITSSSGVQLTAQTETYIRNLCEKINKFWGKKIFKINQRYIKCLATGSEIRLFATDEAGKAEGYHPIEPNRAFALIANEAKSISEPIFAALKRCNGFTHYIMVSSPGEPIGSFHWAFKTGVEKKHGWKCRRVTSYDCTHIPPSEIESDKAELGEHSSLFRSKHLALFTSVGGQVIISDDKWLKCHTYCTVWMLNTAPIRVGLDLAAGGDECVISAWRGNKRIKQITFVEADTEITADIIDRELTSLGIPKNHDYIKADDGGIGRGIIDKLVRRGWNIRRVLNNSQARDKKMYGNKGAEMWYNFCRLVEECLILRPLDSAGNPDEKFETQLTTRHYAQSKGGSSRIFLQSKGDAKSEGHPSPDRADAAMLALEDLRVSDFIEARDGIPTQPKAPALPSLEEFVKQKESEKFAYHDAVERGQFDNLHLLEGIMQAQDARPQKPTTKHISCSLDCAL